jgi:hypothetical protein
MRTIRTACVMGALLFAVIATATDRRSVSMDARDPAVREAQAARVEARRGGLTDVDQTQRERNLYARCNAHQGEDRDYCIRRMNGEGTVSGSVEGGGIYRELRVTVPAQ